MEKKRNFKNEQEIGYSKKTSKCQKGANRFNRFTLELSSAYIAINALPVGTRSLSKPFVEDIKLGSTSMWERGLQHHAGRAAQIL